MRPAAEPFRPARAAVPLLAAVLCAPAVLGAGAQDPVARVRVIATGGTIANSPARRLTAGDLISQLPHRRQFPRVDAETFASVPSASLTLDDCARLARRIIAVFEGDPDLEGVVVTSGTDTLEELAWFLHLTVPGNRPVVLTGAMRRPGAAGADGERNLEDAVRVAGSRDARGRGAVVVMHGQVHSARLVRKTHTTDLGAFDAPARERIGTVTRGRVQLGRTTAPPAVPPGALALASDAPLPRVDLLLTYQGATGDLIDAAVTCGAHGIVLAAAGAGALTPSQSEAARRAARAGLPVVIASRTGAGPVTPSDALGGSSLFAAGDLAPVKARLLLMLGLARGMGMRDIAALFEQAAGAKRF